jgi:hypothetical protein
MSLLVKLKTTYVVRIRKNSRGLAAVFNNMPSLYLLKSIEGIKVSEKCSLLQVNWSDSNLLYIILKGHNEA